MTLIKNKEKTSDVKVCNEGVTFCLVDERYLSYCFLSHINLFVFILLFVVYRECFIKEVRLNDNVNASCWAGKSRIFIEFFLQSLLFYVFLDLGANVWEPAVLISRLLDCREIFPDAYFLNKSLVELGAGVGLAGMTGAMLGAKAYLTDMKISLPFLEANIDRNVSSMRQRPVVTELAWGPHPSLQSFIQSTSSSLNVPGFDFILAGECLYIESIVSTFFYTVSELCDVRHNALTSSSLSDSVKVGEEPAERKVSIPELVDRDIESELLGKDMTSTQETIIILCGIIGPTTLEAFLAEAQVSILLLFPSYISLCC